VVKPAEPAKTETVAKPAATAPASDRKTPPKTHTVDKEGVMHAPGFATPAQKCAPCHGKELTGGRVAKTSCLECHEKKW
jgi:hypothetical protein